MRVCEGDRPLGDELTEQVAEMESDVDIETRRVRDGDAVGLTDEDSGHDKEELSEGEDDCDSVNDALRVEEVESLTLCCPVVDCDRELVGEACRDLDVVTSWVGVGGMVTVGNGGSVAVMDCDSLALVERDRESATL